MSVTAETSHSAMGPYVVMAAVGLVLYAWTAVCREALVVKVYCCGGEGDGGGGLGERHAPHSAISSFETTLQRPATQGHTSQVKGQKYAP